MEQEYLKEQQYLNAKKRVKEIKGFYSHLLIYVLINIFISGIIIFGLSYSDNYSLLGSLTNFGVYSSATTGTFSDVISGISSSNLNSLTGTFGAWNWTLSDANTDNSWDLDLAGNLLSSVNTESNIAARGAASVIDQNGDLIFFSESFIVTTFALIAGLFLVQLALPTFNQVADKQLFLPFSNHWFIASILGFSLGTGFFAFID